MGDVRYYVYIDWDNDGSVFADAPTTNEDVSANVLGVRTALSWAYGRDSARSLSAIAPGDMTVELNNRTRIYSPDNATSALFGNLGTGKPIRVKAVHNTVTYNMFWGYIDQFSIDPSQSNKSVTLTAIDALAKLADSTITTALYPSLQAGQAVNLVLDLAGWPSTLRDIDPGASTFRWFWLDQKGALEALTDINTSEGGPAIIYVDPGTGNFVFRDRHHRFLRSASITSQVTFRDNGLEPTFCEPVEYEIGFRDLINAVTFNVDEREPIAEGVVWSTDASFTLAAGETQVIQVAADEPFLDALDLVSGTDYVVQTGTATATLAGVTSGQTTTITLSADPSTSAIISGLQLRAKSVPVARTFTVDVRDQASIDKNGIQAFTDTAPPFADRHDAKAIAEIMVAQRSTRLPFMSITVNNGNDTRKVQQLSRKLSDRITIVESETGTNHEHMIEKIEHTIEQVGFDHRVTFSCERIRIPPNTAFTFDVAGSGFGQGTLGLAGCDNAATIFTLDSAVSGHRLDTGKLGT